VIFWLSFCDPDRPKGTQFLGAVMIEAPDLPAAIRRAWKKNCNPGGEIVSTEVPPGKHADARRYLNRLMQRDEIERTFGRVNTPEEMDASIRFESACPACNSGVGQHTHERPI
jgi:hypothetical protein